MTNNEKAATYIGWREWCSNFDCWIRHPAPDMTRPENYMRALEMLPASLTWTMGRDPRGGYYCRIMGSMYGVQDTKGEGINPVEALAALYDKEHAND